MNYKQIDIANISVSNNLQLVLFGGLNVLESRDLTLSVAENFKATCAELGVPLVFKASFDKANRSSINSFRGPGLEEGLNWLAEVKSQFNMPIITDIHEPDQAAAVSEIAEVLQLPAFLSRQTDLIVAMAKTGAAINIKKAQFLAPREMLHVLKKFESEGNQRLMLCERGSSFGYNNLVGSPSELIDQIKTMEEAGLTQCIAQNVAVNTVSEWNEMVQMFGEEVIPAFR